MKPNSIELVLSLSQECAKLAQDLILTLEKERLGLVSFDIEKITQSTIEKSFLVNQLASKRNELKRVVKIQYGKDLVNFETEIPLKDQEKWKHFQQTWRRLYFELNLKCQSNQGLLKHSLKNVDLLLGNLKTLFGNPSIYDQKGKKQDLSSSGRVLEGRF